MGRLNWDRVRTENRVRRHGTESAWAHGGPPEIAVGDSGERLRPKRASPLAPPPPHPKPVSPRAVAQAPKAPRTEMVRCPACRTKVSRARVEGHLRRHHPDYTPPTLPRADAAAVRTSPPALLRPAPRPSPSSVQLAAELARHFAAFILRRAQELGVRSTSVGSPLPPAVVAAIRAEITRKPVQGSRP